MTEHPQPPPSEPEPSEPDRAAAAARRRRTNPLAVVGVLVLALASYFVFIGIRGFYLVEQDRWVLRILGVAVLLLPLIGIWVVVAELRFGAASQRLAEQLRLEGAHLALPELPRSASGRPLRNDRTVADRWFDQRRVDVEAAPDDWRGWFRLAEAYDLAGDRKRARAALRTSIEKHAEGQRPRPSV
ncbi:MAG: hypothetical protein JWN95_3506 [Frankiales bacterium]|nr:hypothetical protein [Frankiales bacterium]